MKGSTNITQKEQQDLYSILLEFPKIEVQQAMEKVQKTIADNGTFFLKIFSFFSAPQKEKKSMMGKVMNKIGGKNESEPTAVKVFYSAKFH